MTPVEVLAKFRRLGVKLWLDGERLRYSAQKGLLTPELSAELAANKGPIVQFLRSARSHEKHTPPLLAPVARDGELPLSFAQQRLWFLDQLEPNSPVYNIPYAVQLNGPIDLSALERSVNRLVQRQESLRTCFPTNDGQPAQSIRPPEPFTLKVEDLTSMRDELRGAELRRLLDDEARRPFDLAAGPLFRLRLFRLGEEEHVLAVTMHHIISDGWSMGVATRELGALYTADTQGVPSSLPELSLQYADYAAWQREWLQGEVLEEQLSYWRRRLAGAPSVLELPTDKPRPPRQSHRGSRVSMQLDAETTRLLKALSRKHNTTLFITVLAGFQALLSRWSGETDVVVGTVVAGRNKAETEGLIGFFVNTLAMRTDLSGDPTIAELLARATEVCLGAFGHQDVPFEKLIEELGIDRDMSRTPLVQVVLVLQNTADEALEMPGLRMSEVVRGRGAGLTGTAKFDLQVTLNEGAGGIQGSLDYNLDLFEQETVRRMARQLERVLRAVAEDENCRVSELPLMSEDEQKRLVAGWNRKTQEFACAGSLAESFERAARQNPEAVAVTFEGEEVSYGELDRRSNQLAHHLRDLGVQRETRVALFLERSVEMIVAILATIKAGAAYVPLEVSLPFERIAFMLEDAECTHVLTETRFASQLAVSPAQVITLDTVLTAPSDENYEALCVSIDAQNAAYVIYTSGSTGKPKGVVVTHGNVMRLMTATKDWFSFSSSDAWTLFHSYAFDFSVWELWGALLYGGRLVVVPYWVSRSPEEFYGLLLRESVTVLNQTPSAFRQLMKAEEQLTADAATKELALRVVVFGGEALEPASLRPWYERHGDKHPQLVNMYGITETTVHVTHRPLTRADAEGAHGSVIGWRIPDLRLYVLDGGMRPVPSGVAGELYVGGAGLARGYLNRPELTAERFPPDPLSAETGARLYHTGDVVRFGAAGELEYLRRADEQVKVRGFRIEPGEVEAALLSHEAVREAAVIARDEGGGHRLIAYVVGAPGVAVPNASALREHLRRVLPEYLVPAVFVALDSLPLTSNGKVDRRALPVPQRDVVTAEYVAPRTEAERTLAAVWEEVLGAGHAGVEDNFFDLGGDSIRSVRVVALAKKRGLNFTVEQLFRHQTIAALVRQLNNNGTDDSTALSASADGPFSLISRQDRERMPDGVEDAYPLSMLQAGMLFHGDISQDLYHNYTSLHLRASFNAHALESAVRRLIEHHPILRTSFDLTSYSVPLQLVHRSVELPLQVEDLRAMSDADQEATIAKWQDDERRRRIDWSQAPLVRFHVHLRGENSFQFSFAEHHAILDGWSVATMLAELFRSYSSSGVEEPDEPPPASLYRDFVALEQKALMSPDAEQFWRQWLYGSSVITVPRLYAQRAPEEPAPTHIINLPVTPELSDALKRTARETGVPIKSVLLAAHLRVLSHLGGQDDVMTGMVSHGRPEAADAERALGLYLNTLPFRLRLRGGTWAELAREAFAAEVDAMPFRYYPMAQVKIDQGGRALFETCFNFTHFHVLDGVQRSNEIDLLDQQAFVRTEFVLTADFSLKGSDARVHLTLIGDGEVLTREHLESIRGYYAAALTALADEPAERYELKSLLSDKERERLVVEWNDTAAEYPRELCIHQVFEQEVQLRPDTVAVESVDQQLSYAELNRRADALAVALRRRGVGPDVLVAVMLERSVEMIVALLAVNKAGGSYVPLNLSDPPARLRFIVEDTAARVLLTSTKFRKEIAREAIAVDVICVDVICVDANEHAAEDSAVAALEATPDNLAYMLYTSGSTGKPKGVSVTHSGVVSLVRSNKYIKYGPDEVMLEFSPVSFDASTYEIWGALLNGGRLVVFPQVVPSVRELGEFVVRTQVTSFLLTPALFHQFIDVNAGALGALRQMLSGGDVLSPAPLDRAAALIEGRSVINVYGPTETTVMCCAYVVPRERPAGSIPIGGPVPNTQIYVVNGSQPSGVGERGEIYIGGVGLARGYHNRPDLTAERFVPDPFGKQPGGRLYRTGDAGRHLPEGVIQFIGRLDEQVKISGFRIEPGEIEAALETHPAVATAVAVVNEETPHDKRLIAYVVAKESPPAVGVDELRAYLKERVPEYMTPSAFVMLDTLPLTPHGKVDKAALPAPQTNTGRPAGEYVGPRNTIERQLVVIWEELFKTSPIGVRDNFFDLGGHSLLLMMLVGRIEERLGERVAMADLFNGPTIENLAQLISQHGRPTVTSVIVPMQTSGTRPLLFGLHPGSEEVWCYSELVRRLGTDQPFYGVQARRLDAAGFVKHTELEAMASDYAEALCEFHPGGPYLLCGWSMGGVIAFEVARQLRARGERVALLALIDSQAPSKAQSKPSWFTLLAILALDLGLANEKLVALLEEIRNLPPPGQLRRVWAETRRAGVIPAEMTLLEFRRLFDTFKASAEMMHRYEPGEYVGRVALIRAEKSLEEDPSFVRFDDWNETEVTDPSHDWARLAAEGVDVHVVPGNHFSIMREPFVEALAERLRGCIDETLRSHNEAPPRAFAHVHQVV